VTGITTTIQSQPNQNLLNARQIGSQQISQSLTKLAEEALKDSINIPTTIYVDQGTRIVVFVKRISIFELLPRSGERGAAGAKA